jgi:hypothetical protein
VQFRSYLKSAAEVVVLRFLVDFGSFRAEDHRFTKWMGGGLI